jgi:hypothetical protein
MRAMLHAALANAQTSEDLLKTCWAKAADALQQTATKPPPLSRARARGNQQKAGNTILRNRRLSMIASGMVETCVEDRLWS